MVKEKVKRIHNIIMKPGNNQAIYFQFEKDFVEDGIRCIPMMVRFKLDACGIKLRLKEWSKFSPDKKNIL